MVQDVGGRDVDLRPVKSESPWKYVDVGGYCSGGLRFRHIQSPDYSGLFAFLGHRKATHGNTFGNALDARVPSVYPPLSRRRPSRLRRSRRSRGYFLVFAHALARALSACQPPFPSDVGDVGEGGDLSHGPALRFGRLGTVQPVPARRRRWALSRSLSATLCGHLHSS